MKLVYNKLVIIRILPFNFYIVESFKISFYKLFTKVLITLPKINIAYLLFLGDYFHIAS